MAHNLGPHGSGSILYLGSVGDLVEYRKAFFTDRLSFMSIEVIANIVRHGGPGYLAMLALVTGLPMFSSSPHCPAMAVRVACRLSRTTSRRSSSTGESECFCANALSYAPGVS